MGFFPELEPDTFGSLQGELEFWGRVSGLRSGTVYHLMKETISSEK